MNTHVGASDLRVLTSEEIDSVGGGIRADTFDAGVITFMSGIVGGAIAWVIDHLFSR